MPDISIEKIAEAMYQLIKQDKETKKHKPADLTKKMIEYFGEEEVDKMMCKQAIQILVDEDKLVYTYFGGSFLELPHEEKADKR